MAGRKMLIDALHPEETRVVVVDGAKLEDYDVEVASRRQLKGNIYLAKVTRVEPSLQAAFVEYGGNRHGFLAFNEIHPDYYQIPVADRERLLAEQEAAERYGSSDDDDETGAVDDEDEAERRRTRLSPRNYKIQEVIKRRQIMLVQVAKEERGNKGAALTTYLSLAGRYCVLMPNTSRGGISRKIQSPADRKRLKKILSDLEVPEGMAVIVRTAGAGRNKAEVKRDYEYLLRLWSNIRELTLSSSAPALVYEEASLIKRSIRDLYERDIEEIIIQGEPEYRIAKEFMKLFIPSHAKRVKLFEEADQALFRFYNMEDSLDLMHQPIVQLRSGGYIVINPTEALVSIDVNSGRATRERHIEETALRTNLEAADEIARHLRLRDLAGLVVIDFIDMENSRNQGQVERRLKEAMKNDRARTQIGRISPFGLLELSRQRLRPSLLETSFEGCRHCHGSGVVRTTESTALAVLRQIEDEANRTRAIEFLVAAPPAVAMYLLNYKRQALAAIEQRFQVVVRIVQDAELTPPDHRIERVRAITVPLESVATEGARVVATEDEGEVEDEDDEGGRDQAESGEADAVDREESARRGRRRRGRRRRRPDDEAALPAGEPETPVEASEDGGDAESDEEEEFEAEAGEQTETTGEAAEESAEAGRKRRRRGKRGGRRRSRRPAGAVESAESASEVDEERVAVLNDEDDDVAVAPYEPEGVEESHDGDVAAASAAVDENAPAVDPATAWDAAATSPTTDADAGVESSAGTDAAPPAADEAAAKPKRRTTRRRRPAKDAAAEPPPSEVASAAEAEASDVEPTQPTTPEPATAAVAEAGDVESTQPTEPAPEPGRVVEDAFAAEVGEAEPVEAAQRIDDVAIPDAAEEAASEQDQPPSAEVASPPPTEEGGVETESDDGSPSTDEDRHAHSSPSESEFVEAEGREPRRGWWQRLVR